MLRSEESVPEKIPLPQLRDTQSLGVGWGQKAVPSRGNSHVRGWLLQVKQKYRANIQRKDCQYGVGHTQVNTISFLRMHPLKALKSEVFTKHNIFPGRTFRK